MQQFDDDDALVALVETDGVFAATDGNDDGSIVAFNDDDDTAIDLADLEAVAEVVVLLSDTLVVRSPVLDAITIRGVVTFDAVAVALLLVVVFEEVTIVVLLVTVVMVVLEDDDDDDDDDDEVFCLFSRSLLLWSDEEADDIISSVFLFVPTRLTAIM